MLQNNAIPPCYERLMNLEGAGLWPERQRFLDNRWSPVRKPVTENIVTLIVFFQQASFGRSAIPEIIFRIGVLIEISGQPFIEGGNKQ